VTVSGHLLRAGGPAGTPDEGVPGTITFSGASVSKTVTVPADGSYSVVLPAGVYTAGGTSPLLGVECHAQPSTVDIQDPTTVDVICDIR